MANIENMKLTLALLERVRDEERPFDIYCWEAPLERYRQNVRYSIYIGSGKIDHDCGFAACVGGWMMNDPDHNERGLFKTSHREPAMKIENDSDYSGLNVFGANAIAQFWGGVPRDKVAFITNPDRYQYKPVTIDMAINRLESLIREYEPIFRPIDETA